MFFTIWWFMLNILCVFTMWWFYYTLVRSVSPKIFVKFFSAKRQLQAVQISSHYSILENILIFPEIHLIWQYSIMLLGGADIPIFYAQILTKTKQNTPQDFTQIIFLQIGSKLFKIFSPLLHLFMCLKMMKFWSDVFKSMFLNCYILINLKTFLSCNIV